MKSYKDQELISNYFVGNEKSLQILFGRYLRLVYSLAYRYTRCRETAEDLTQEIFVKAWRNLKKFDQQRDFKPWLMTIAKNTTTDYWRRHHQDAINFSELALDEASDEAEFLIDPASLTDEILDKKTIRRKLTRSLQKLTQTQRLVVALRHDDNLTFREMSRVLGEPLNTVKSRYRRALIALKQIIS